MPIEYKGAAAKLRNAKANGRRIVQKLYAAGQLIEMEAERSITNGSISGAGHIPSLPGQPPNADTRFLDTNIETEIASVSPPTVTVTSKAPYSAALEFGTSKMVERPFMRPATKKYRSKVHEMVREGLDIRVRRRR